MNYHYRDRTGQEIGPLTLDALAKLRFGGVLDGDTLIRETDSTAWKQCREIIADPHAAPDPTSVTTTVIPVKSGAWKHGWGLFALAALCFLLPFADISCRSQKIATFTGQDFVIGKEVEQPADPWTGKKETKRLPPYTEAKLALGLAVAALLLSLVRKFPTSVLSAIAGTIGAFSLFALKIELEQEVSKQGEGVIQLIIKEGFWAALLCLVIGAIIQCKLVADLSKQNASLKPQTYKGFGGWLAVFCVFQVIVVPVLCIPGLILLVAEHGRLEALPRNLFAAIVVHIIGTVAIAGFGCYAGLILWRKRAGAVRLVKRYLLTSLAFSLFVMVLPVFIGFSFGDVSAAQLHLITAESGGSEMPRVGGLSSEAWGLVSAFLAFAIWYLYFEISKRIRATFTAPEDAPRGWVFEKRDYVTAAVFCGAGLLLYG